MSAITPSYRTGAQPGIETGVGLSIQQAIDAPDHAVVNVVIMDNVETACGSASSDASVGVVSFGLDYTPSVRTYAVGLTFAASNLADVLADIAFAGNTEPALIVYPEADMAGPFLAALQSIRTDANRCLLRLPQPMGGPLDLSLVNVDHLAAGSPMVATLPRVNGAQSCPPGVGGWYYDADPLAGGTPTRIVLCPDSCSALTSVDEVSLRVGCPSQAP